MDEYTLGSHAARLDNIEKRLSSIDTKVDVLLAAENKRQGAWKGIAMAGGFAGAAAAFLANIVKVKLLGGS